jgi:hypothetical protein
VKENTNMNSRWLRTAALITAVGIFGSGCIINVSETRGAYDRCNIGDVCRGASTCIQSGLMVTGMTVGSLCSQSCSSGVTCPIGFAGNAPACVNNQCYSTCAGVGDCPAGNQCAAVAVAGGGAISVCVPSGGGTGPACGDLGQPCCAGATCTAAGATCNVGRNVCAPAVYIGCTAASIGAACSDGPSNGNPAARVQTSCVRPPFSNAGPAGYCSTVCDGTNNSCPSFPGSTTGCYSFQGMTQPMCFVDCVTNPGICPTGTACVMLTGNTGAQVRVCAPPVAG